MSPELYGIILIAFMFLFLAIGTEVAVAMGMAGVIGLLFFVKQPLSIFAFAGFEVVNSFILTAVPLFILMGSTLHYSGTSEKLFNATDKLVNFLPGGVGLSVIAANAIFGAMSGSSVAAVATFGKICYPNMRRLGYESKFALGTIAVGGTLSVLIPPSIILVVYGGWLNISVTKLFAAGIIPGLILTSFLMLTIFIMVKKNPNLAPKITEVSLNERVGALIEIAPFSLIIILVLGLLFGGVMTPTESGALGAFLSICLALAYRRLNLKVISASLREAVRISAMLAYLLLTAKVLGQVFQYLGLTERFSSFMMNLPVGKYGVLIIIYIMYLVLGCLFDSISMLVLTLPFVGPLMVNLGFDLVWFGIIYVLLAEIGFITPPFGLNLFVLNSVLPEVSIIDIVKGCLPLLISFLVAIVIFTVFPQVVLWLPGGFK